MHVNMLKRWRSSLASAFTASVVHDEDDPEDGNIVTKILGDGSTTMFLVEPTLVQ